ncbi:SusC/RagA family TonB-linked outer membrane protein [Halosquirtibacter xylanolyticus]|uniref:SusC/RagA family TonB-linked outer membrane protein n=1 Tax=Halosquirtibacter xylanolyticus TaxID=3374599 RepID=UPI003748E54D|nr:SusC/RagA family TonB-linked outer membrane protein [Prolixibacteraceae bacterium]
MNRIYLYIIIGLCFMSLRTVAQSHTATNKNSIDYASQNVVESDVLERSPETDVKKSLYGKLAGLSVFQGKGRSSVNFASLKYHGFAPLILVDGFPRDINNITMAEIESITLLKDAASLAIYGVRGANGVLNITTKSGVKGKMDIDVKYQFGVNERFRSPEFADAYTYATKLNEALTLDGLAPKYSAQEVGAFQSGAYPYAYPNVDWQKEVYEDYGFNHQAHATFKGGGEKYRYFVAGVYSYDKAMYKDLNENSRYSTVPFDVRLNLRANVDADLTNTTKMKVGLMVRMQEVNGSYAQNVSRRVFYTPSAAFPVKTEDGIYGGNNIYTKNNPVAFLSRNGHRKDIYKTMNANIGLHQDLKAIIKGLYADASISFDNYGALREWSVNNYRYSDLKSQIMDDGTVVMTPEIYGKDSQLPSFKNKFEKLYLKTNFKGALGYQNKTANHDFAMNLMYDYQSDLNNGRNRTYERQSYLTNMSYTYKNRYYLHGVVNYSGTNLLPEDQKYNTYYAVSGAWTLTEENFINIPGVDLFKLRGSYGTSGWDRSITHELFRQSYGSSGYYVFGLASGASGWSEGRLPVQDLKITTSERSIIGMDLEMFKNRLAISLDGFYEKRSDNLVDISNSVSGVIGIDVAKMSSGVNEYKGVDISMGWNDDIGNFSYGLSGTFSFIRSKIIDFQESYKQYDYLYRTGNRAGQRYGLESVGFFQDQVDINNSPVHTFSTVRPGDIKYKDQNGDNRVDSEDVVKMYQTGYPEIYYGFNLNIAYKSISLSADFQGVANRTINLLDSPLYKPLIGNGNVSLTFIDRETIWTPENHDRATMPRLTTAANINNYRNSSTWYRDGSFLKLRNLRLALDRPKFSIYICGTNLFSFDHIDFTDPEQLGIAYPTVRSYWAGLKFNF